MANLKVYVAADLGAESGRVVAGEFDGERLALNELHRFSNRTVRLLGHLHWDLLGLYADIKTGLARAGQNYGDAVAGVGVDTWGVDYAWEDACGRMLANPYHYRDHRTDGIMDEAFRMVPRRAIYEATGIQFLFFNTLYQVLSEALEQDPLLGLARRLLFIPDWINYWLTGRAANERTIAGTSQLLDPRTGDWNKALMAQLKLPADAFGEVVEPASVLGKLTAQNAEELGVGPWPVLAVGSHDTASAVAAVPAFGESFAYLSSGTWSLMGVESAGPVITDASYEAGLTNEIGLCGSIRLLKNIAGLWLVQECRRAWQAAGTNYTYPELTQLAEEAEPFKTRIDTDHEPFSRPGEMPGKIAEYCHARGLHMPSTPGAFVRCCLESLAFRYREVLDLLEKVTGRRVETLHIVGGGAQNRLLNQFAANATGRPVLAGPIEATAAGNILAQMLALGDIKSLAEGRALIAKSFPLEAFEPRETDRWTEAAER